MSDSLPRVNLRQLRNQAKDFNKLAQTKAAAADVLARIRRHHPRFTEGTPQQIVEGFSLQEAQHVVAREHGYDSWPRLVADATDREEADRQGRFVKDELRGIENLHEAICEFLQDAFHRAGAVDSSIDIQFVDQVRWSEFLGSRPIGSWSYSYMPTPLQGFAVFDLPVETARILGAQGRVDPVFVTQLEEVVAGTRDVKTISNDDHKRFIGPLLDNGIEAAWEPAMKMEMAEIHFEPDAEKQPKRTVAEPSNVVAYVQLATDAEDVALRLCYPYRTMIPVLGELASFA
tara:strand:+ start:887 stop:1750 length:864 start_codon:yes stop_codon:yes gene_type:complete